MISTMTKDIYGPKSHIVLLCKGVDYFCSLLCNFLCTPSHSKIFKNNNLPLGGTLWDLYTTRVPKRNDFFLKIVKDNFEFLFILHYYSCNGFLYVNR